MKNLEIKLREQFPYAFASKNEDNIKNILRVKITTALCMHGEIINYSMDELRSMVKIKSKRLDHKTMLFTVKLKI